MRALRVAGGLVASLLIILILLLGTLAIGGGSVVAWLLEHPASRLAGRQIVIDGPVSIRWGEPTRFIAENIRLANARWGSRPDMFLAQHAEIDIEPRSLLGGAPHVRLLLLERVMLLLETAPDGERNWDFARTLVGADGERAWPTPGQIVLRDGTFIFRNRAGAERMVAVDRLAVDAPDVAAPIKFSAAGTYQRQSIRLSGTMGPLGELRHPSGPYPVTLETRIADSNLTVRATAARPLALAGIDATLDFISPRPDELATAFGLAPPPLPELRIAGELTGGDGDWALRGLTVKFGQSNVEGSVALSTRGVPPHLRADFSSSFIDLDDLAGLAGAARSGASAPPDPRPIEPPGGRVIPELMLRPPQLPGANIDLNLHGARIAASKLPPLEDVVVALRLRDGVLALDPMTFGVAGGQVMLDVSVNPAHAPQLALGVDIRRVDLAELVSRAALPPYVKDARGIAGGFVRVRGVGTSLRDFLGRMEGTAGVFAENSAFSPALQRLLDRGVLEALGFDSGARAVPVSCMVSLFNLKSGVVTASTLLLDTPEVTLLGQGSANFGAETIYVDITPHHKQVTPATLSTPVEVRGTYAGVTIRPGAASIVEQMGAAIEPGVPSAPPTLLPLVDVALGANNACTTAFGTQKTEDAAVGSSRPPKKPRP